MDKIVIEFSSDPQGLKDTIASLEKMKKIEKETADNFNAHNQKHKDALKDHGSLTDKLGDKFTDLAGKIAAAFAIEKIIEFGLEAVKAYGEAQKAAQQLQFAVTKVNGESAKSFKELTEQSEKLSSSLNHLYSPVQIQKAQTMLANAKFSAENIQKLMPRILDISATTGRSVDEITEKMILTLNSGRNGLKELGVRFKTTGDTVKDFNNIMESTKTFTGGAADAMKTFSGQEQIATNNSEMLAEKIGKELAPAWESFKTRILAGLDVIITGFINLTKGVDTLQDHFNQTPEQTKMLNDLGFSFGRAGKDAKKMSEEVIIMSGAMDMLKEDAKEFKTLDQFNTAINNIKKSKDALDRTTESGNVLNTIYRNTIKSLREEMDLFQQKQKEGAQEEVNITKMTNAQLEARKQAIEDAMAANENFEGKNLVGEQKLIKAIDAEIEARKKASEKYAEFIKKQNAERIRADNYEYESIKKQVAALEKITQSRETATEKENREYEEKLKAANLFGRDIATLNAEELAALEIAEEQHKKALLKIQDDYNKEKLTLLMETAKQQDRIQSQMEDMETEKLKATLNKQYQDGLISEEEYQKKLYDIDNKAKIQHDKDVIENLKKSQQTRKDFLDKELEEGLITKAEYDKEILTMEADMNDAELKLTRDQNSLMLDEQKKAAEQTKKFIEGVQEFSEKIINALEEHINSVISSLDTMQQRQESMIQTQRVLASKGLANDLAFEQRRADQLEQQKLKEQRKLKKAKELEVFLNALAKYAEDDPKSALGKALGLLATTKIAEALFAEQGGVVGTGMTMAGGKRHASGRDRLVLAEDGEGILSKKEMNMMGGPTGFAAFRNMLRTPLREKVIGDSRKDYGQEIVGRLESLEKTVRNKTELNVSWDSLDARIEERIERGIKERIRISSKKSRL